MLELLVISIEKGGGYYKLGLKCENFVFVLTMHKQWREQDHRFEPREEKSGYC